MRVCEFNITLYVKNISVTFYIHIFYKEMFWVLDSGRKTFIFIESRIG